MFSDAVRLVEQGSSVRRFDFFVSLLFVFCYHYIVYSSFR